MILKRFILASLAASLFAASGEANNGVLFGGTEDPTYETPMETLSRDRSEWAQGRSLSPMILPDARGRRSLLSAADQTLVDRLSRDTPGPR